ncbi:spermidine resistance protein [Kappamyces sp. JEL0829]|nr:spermidine resistance protein [Kappamyces sp. JEL0829]
MSTTMNLTVAPDNPVSLTGFEGPEKLLEIWFNTTSSTGLRAVDPAVWHEMLKIVQCQVLSTIHNESADAYLLSESSMFVYSNRLILKTCGTTTLLHSVPRILQIAEEHCKLTKVDAIFYSRKSFLFPDRQEFPHGSWSDEVLFLDSVFPKTQFDTAGYVIGKTNGDHWCLYLATPLALNSDGIPATIREVDEISDEVKDDVTLEILMHDLDPSSMQAFWRTEDEEQQGKLPHNLNVRKHQLLNPRRLYNDTGISEIYPDSIVDDYIFDPCGYSANGLLGPYYYTIHVTPEAHCSYASFETTVPISALKDGGYTCFNQVIQKVVDIFQPARFSTVFVRRNTEGVVPSIPEPSLPAFKHRDRILHSLGIWEVSYSHYEKKSQIFKNR